MQRLSNSNEAAAQRLRTAFDLFEFGVDMMRQKLRREDPDATEEEFQERLVAWLRTVPASSMATRWDVSPAGRGGLDRRLV